MIDSAGAKKVEQGEVGRCAHQIQQHGCAIERPWLALGSPFLSFGMNGLSNKFVGSPFSLFKACFQLHKVSISRSDNWWVMYGCKYLWEQFQALQPIASFPGHRRNSLATSASSNCYFRCLKVGSTNQISERSHMTTVKPNCVMH